MADSSEGKLRDSVRAFGEVFASPNLRRLQLAWAGSNIGTWAYGVALAVFAYGEGGAAAVGIVGLIRWIPAALAAPFFGVLADRYPRRRVMILSDLGRAVVITFAGLAALGDLDVIWVYALAGVGTVISTAFRPAQAALVPKLAETPLQLTASNVVSSTIESVGMFLGPAIGGLLLIVTSPGGVFLVTAAMFLWSAGLVALIRTDADAGRTEEEAAAAAGVLHEILDGFRAIFAPKIRLLIALFCAQVLIAGALAVLEVVIALEVLGKDEAWVGAILAAFGVGGIVGAVVSGMLVSRQRLAFDFSVGIMLWGLPLVAIAMWSDPYVALAAFAVMGVGNTLVDVAGFTLMQRSVDDAVLARVFAVFETLFLLTVSLGAILTPLLLDVWGNTATLVVVGVFLPCVMVVTWKRLQTMDREAVAPIRQLELLHGIPIFASLPAPVLESLAGALTHRTIPANTEIFAQGAAGDLFYVVASGRVEVVRDGVPVLDVTPGGFFGEIALLHGVPRQAAVRTLEETEVFTLDGEQFIAAVTGHASSLEAAGAAIGSYGLGGQFGFRQ